LDEQPPLAAHHQHRRPAAKAKGLGRKVLVELGTIATLETLLPWHRSLTPEYPARCNSNALNALPRGPELPAQSPSKRTPGKSHIQPHVKGKSLLDYPEHQDWPAILTALERDGFENCRMEWWFA
jgi:hypothetical protein